MNYYYDVTYRNENSDIYQSIIVQTSRSELAEQYVKENGGIIASVVAKANIDEDKRKGKPVVTIRAKLLTKPYIETMLKKESLWQAGEVKIFQYKNNVVFLSRISELRMPFKYEIEGKKLYQDGSIEWLSRSQYKSLEKALLDIVNEFKDKYVDAENKYQHLSEYIYPVGTRIELSNMDDPQAVPSGTRGTVNFIDDAGQIHMKWDNGRTLAVILGVDDFRLLTDDEIKTEKEQVKKEPDITDDYDY